MFWTLLHHASNSGWGVVVRRLMENLGLMIPVLFALALPLVLSDGLRLALWEWIPEKRDGMNQAKLDVDNYKEVDKYLQEAKQKVNKAEKKVKALDAGKAAQGDIKPGQARFFDDKIKAAQSYVDKLSVDANKSPDEVRNKLVENHFKHKHALLHVKRNYLNEPFWLIRFVAYAVVLGGGIFILRSMSVKQDATCLLYTSPSPRDQRGSRMPSSA